MWADAVHRLSEREVDNVLRNVHENKETTVKTSTVNPFPIVSESTSGPRRRTMVKETCLMNESVFAPRCLGPLWLCDSLLYRTERYTQGDGLMVETLLVDTIMGNRVRIIGYK